MDTCLETNDIVREEGADNEPDRGGSGTCSDPYGEEG